MNGSHRAGDEGLLRQLICGQAPKGVQQAVITGQSAKRGLAEKRVGRLRVMAEDLLRVAHRGAKDGVLARRAAQRVEKAGVAGAGVEMWNGPLHRSRHGVVAPHEPAHSPVGDGQCAAVPGGALEGGRESVKRSRVVVQGAVESVPVALLDLPPPGLAVRGVELTKDSPTVHQSVLELDPRDDRDPSIELGFQIRIRLVGLTTAPRYPARGSSRRRSKCCPERPLLPVSRPGAGSGRWNRSRRT